MTLFFIIFTIFTLHNYFFYALIPPMGGYMERREFRGPRSNFVVRIVFAIFLLVVLFAMQTQFQK